MQDESVLVAEQLLAEIVPFSLVAPEEISLGDLRGDFAVVGGDPGEAHAGEGEQCSGNLSRSNMAFRVDTLPCFNVRPRPLND